MLPDDLSPEARKYWNVRPHRWRVIYKVLREYNLSNMVYEGTDDPYPLVDNMTCEGGNISEGEVELVILADEISLEIDRLSKAKPHNPRHRR